MVEQAQEELYRWGDSPSLRESFVKKEPEFRARARGGRQSGASVLIPHSSPRSTSLITRPPTTYFEEIRRFDTPAPNSVMAA